MRNEDISNNDLADYCRSIAEEEAKEGEFHPHEHTLWMAAARIEDLADLFFTENVPERLRAIAAILEIKDEKLSKTVA